MAKRFRKRVETLLHEEASRKNIPTAEHEPVMADDDRRPVAVVYERRSRDSTRVKRRVVAAAESNHRHRFFSPLLYQLSYLANQPEPRETPAGRRIKSSAGQRVKHECRYERPGLDILASSPPADCLRQMSTPPAQVRVLDASVAPQLLEALLTADATVFPAAAGDADAAARRGAMAEVRCRSWMSSGVSRRRR